MTSRGCSDCLGPRDGWWRPVEGKLRATGNRLRTVVKTARRYDSDCDASPSDSETAAALRHAHALLVYASSCKTQALC